MTKRALPPVVARMWGRDTGSRHGPRPSLDLARIIDAAIGIADREGLAGVRMSSVAAQVGMATMSLYRYVGSKDELLTVMADAATPEPPTLDGRPWRVYLAAWTQANRDFLVDRPWLLSLAHHTPPTGPRTLRWLDRALTALAPTELDLGQRINIASTLTGYATTQATLSHSMITAAAATATATTSAAGDGSITGLADYGDILDQVLDPEDYPELTAAVRSHAFGTAEKWIDDADFTFGLDLLLDGIETLITRRG
ncbi:TetR/AcrR family transcriptional regulator [Plantactinospora mayteni]|uniref:TetR family transcriptional regulator n=1 Tax=Plantactinospora mayteni TaxID=566021 RepID=A0ABQ4ERE2_9ACTN|nr:TetR/AcrR family transcriptional regulator [Plantactinospora mayteni]GIG97221.1 TetR family transcriptional regulator [Plantactinospora mayteni]